MTPRRIRKARQSHQARTVVIQVPDRLSRDAAAVVQAHAGRAFPGRRVILLDGGMTAVTA